MFLSVVIPVFNDAERLRLCLAALEQQTYPHDCYEVIVVDNGSKPAPSTVVEEFAHAVLAIDPTPGAYAARNTGVRLARGELIAFTDADCLPDAEWLANGVSALGAAFDIAGGWIQTVPRDPVKMSAVERYALFWSRQQPDVLARGEAATGNLFTRRSVIAEVGPFDATLRSGSDYEWCHQARALGKRFVAARDAVVQHPARRTLRDIANRERRFTGGQYVRARRVGMVTVARLAVSTLRAGLRMTWTLARDATVAPTRGARMQVALVAIAVTSARMLELGRLLLGGEPRR